MRNPLFQLILIQFREFYREPGIIFWALVFPIAMAWGLGVAFTSKPDQKRDIAIVRDVTSPDSSITALFKNYAKIDTVAKTGALRYNVKSGSKETGFTTFRFNPCTWKEAQDNVKHGNAVVIIEEKKGSHLFHYDPYNSDAQLVYYQLSTMLKSGTILSPTAEIKPITQKGSRYIDFLIPGLIAMNLMMSTMWGISYSLIEKRSKKLLRRLVATPMKKSQFMFAQLIARLVLNLIEVCIVLTFAYFYFGITIEGSYTAAIALYLAGMLCFTGIAVLISSRTANTYVGNGLINAIVMPMMLLSGIFFSYHNFPDAFLPFIQALPLTMLADGLRAVFIEGAGIIQSGITIIVLSTIGIVTFVTGLKVYKWY